MSDYEYDAYFIDRFVTDKLEDGKEREEIVDEFMKVHAEKYEKWLRKRAAQAKNAYDSYNPDIDELKEQYLSGLDKLGVDINKEYKGKTLKKFIEGIKVKITHTGVTGESKQGGYVRVDTVQVLNKAEYVDSALTTIGGLFKLFFDGTLFHEMSHSVHTSFARIEKYVAAIAKERAYSKGERTAEGLAKQVMLLNGRSYKFIKKMWKKEHKFVIRNIKRANRKDIFKTIGHAVMSFSKTSIYGSAKTNFRYCSSRAGTRSIPYGYMYGAPGHMVVIKPATKRELRNAFEKFDLLKS